VRSAQLASLIANVNRDQKKRAKPFTITEFLLFDREEDTPQQTIESHPGDGAHIAPETMAWLFHMARKPDQEPPLNVH
jgi:hypothetical protein